jgi:hypothetical protein
MSNKIRGLVDINLDKPRHLRYDLNALAEIEDKLGISIDQLAGGFCFGMKAIRTVLWAGLIHEDEELTEKEVGAMIDMENIEDVTSSIMDSLGMAFPDAPKNAASGQGAERKSGTGKKSRN